MKGKKEGRRSSNEERIKYREREGQRSRDEGGGGKGQRRDGESPAGPGPRPWGAPPPPRVAAAGVFRARSKARAYRPAQRSLPPDGTATPPGQLPGIPAVSHPEHLRRGRRQQTLRVARAQPPGREAGC